ncbi:hypothetical protein G6N74_04960 [Mesorhizobium sp. CGMCC 1.15528]|uniref:Sarcosine oxidase subunit gamma n=1 Tax=Mesorhizobium zhangyense TaxID=1776730 RepID=A0A7C9V7B0_9HYPH|nr:sarcosine oxidase subunit gamma family protein [Mesorhizobium zhangyense]NGN40406.1 hypothetical protein [Mesorhizobium zhangyense]
MAEQRNWQRLPDRETKTLDVGVLHARNVTGLSQYLISGATGDLTSRLDVSSEGVGALGLASGARYTVRLARDRILAVSVDELPVESGWHVSGCAVSRMTGALEVFEISGTACDELVKRGTTLSLSGSSRSAATLFAGISALLYRYQDQDRIRVHVDRGLAAYYWEWLETVSAEL